MLIVSNFEITIIIITIIIIIIIIIIITIKHFLVHGLIDYVLY